MTSSRRDFLRGRTQPEGAAAEAETSDGLSRRQFLELFAMLLFVLFGIRPKALLDAIKKQPRDGRAMSLDEFRRLLKEHYLPAWEKHTHETVSFGRFIRA